MNWVKLIFFSIGLLTAVWQFFRPPVPTATSMDGVIREYAQLSRRYSLITGAVFLFLVLGYIDEIFGTDL